MTISPLNYFFNIFSRKSKNKYPWLIHPIGNGHYKSVVYVEDGEWHRADGPAIVDRDPQSGQIINQEYYSNGKLHRIDGPAIIMTDRASGVVTLKFYNDGVEYPDIAIQFKSGAFMGKALTSYGTPVRAVIT